MRRWSAVAAAALLLWLACVPAAKAADILDEVWDAAGADAVAEAGEDVVEQTLDGDIDLAAGLGDLLDTAEEELAGLLKEALRSGILLLLTVLLAEMMAGLGASVPGGWKDGVRVIAALTVTGLAVADAGNLIDLGRETIQELDAFTQILTPVMATACAAAGNATGAAVRQAATLLCSSVLMSLVNRLFLPLVYGYIAMVAGACATGNRGLSAVAGLLKWCVTAALKGVLMVYTAFLSFASLAAGGADAMTARLTKSAISGLVPVVGGILSDAADTLLAGAGLLRSVLGIFGVLAVLGFCLTPFLRLGMQYLLYRAVAVLAAVFPNAGLSGLIEELGSAFGLVLGMTGACALMTLISIFAAMAAVLPT